MHTPSVATLREGQRCRATGGRNPMDWVATFLWIEWQLCRGLGGNFPADWVAEFRGIRKSYNEEHGTAIEIRKIKYLNNIVEQDHRGIKRVTRPMLGFKSFDAAQGTLVGIELMHMIKKRQMVIEAGDEGLTAAEQFYSLAA